MRYEHLHSGQLVDAERYDTQGPLPAGMVVWDRAKGQGPQDASWGWIVDETGGAHNIFQGDFIVRVAGTIRVYREGLFHTNFRKVH